MIEPTLRLYQDAQFASLKHADFENLTSRSYKIKHIFIKCGKFIVELGMGIESLKNGGFATR
jgi:hypothetical protein